jgi:hypothetical protein
LGNSALGNQLLKLIRQIRCHLLHGLSDWAEEMKVYGLTIEHRLDIKQN